MLLLSNRIYRLIFSIALVFSTSANAGLYGFSEVNTLPPSPKIDVPPRYITNYRKDMRDLIISLSKYGKSRNKNFQTLIHEGQYLLDKSIWEYHRENYNNIRNQKSPINDSSFLADDITESAEEINYINSYISEIDGIIVNNHYCQKHPISNTISEENIPVFSIEQCSNKQSLDDAISQSLVNNTIIYPFINKDNAFKKTKHQLIINENANNINQASQAKNISFILNSSSFTNHQQMIDDIRNSNYDIVIIKPVFNDLSPFSAEEVHSMKFKKNGAKRLIIAIYNISELSNNSYLWQKEWEEKQPDWLLSSSQTRDNAYIVKYWTNEWKLLVSKYFKSIIDSNYDGVFFTGLENHRYFENELPLE